MLEALVVVCGDEALLETREQTLLTAYCLLRTLLLLFFYVLCFMFYGKLISHKITRFFYRITY